MSLIDSLEARRLFTAGSLDATFGVDGSVEVRTNAHAWAATATDVAVDDAGRTLVAAFYRKHRQVSVTRLNVDGTVDVAFGKSGSGIAAFDSGFNDQAHGTFQIAAGADGRLFVLLKNRLTCVAPNGGIDLNFGTRGAVAMLPVFASVADLTIDPSGRPVLVGTAKGKVGPRAAVVRLRADGTLDPDFGGGSGAYKTPVFSGASVRGAAVRVRDDGRIVGVAVIPDDVYLDPSASGPIDDDSVSLFRLTDAGELDTSYGTGGSTFVSSPQGTTRLDDRDVPTYDDVEPQVLAPDGGAVLRIFRTYAYADNDLGEAATWTAIDADGHVARADFDVRPPDTLSEVYSVETTVVAVEPGGKLLAVSEHALGGHVFAPAVFRTGADGAPDASFAPFDVPGPPEPPVLIEGDRAVTFGAIYADGAYRRSVVRVSAVLLS